MRDAGDFENAVKITGIEIAVRFAERSVRLEIIRRNSAFDHDIRVRRHLEIDGFTFDHFQRAPREPAGKRHLIDTVSNRLHRRIGDAGRPTDDDCRVQRNAPFIALFPMDCGVLQASPHDPGL